MIKGISSQQVNNLINSLQNSFSHSSCCFSAISHNLYWQLNVFNGKHASFDDSNDPTVPQRKHIDLKSNLLFSLLPLKRMERTPTTSCTICLTFLPFDNCFGQFLWYFLTSKRFDTFLRQWFHTLSWVLYCESNKHLAHFPYYLKFQLIYDMSVSTKEVSFLERDLQSFCKDRGRWSSE